MAEWHEFFKLAKPKQQERGGLTLASTTDSQQSLDDAVVRKHRDAERESGFTYTEVGPSIVEQDGSVEHGAVKIKGDYPKPKDRSEMFADAFDGVSPQERAMNRANYDVGVLVARAAIPDWQETIDQPELAIKPDVIEMIAESTLPNRPLITYYLGKHRVEVERLNAMTRKQAQQRIVELSAKLVNNPEGQVLDTADYAVYRRVRNEQVRNRYGSRR